MNNDQIGQLTDEELVALTIENQDYLVYLINRYKYKLTAYFKRITKVSDEEDVEDMLQEIFFKAYRNLNDFDHSYKFSTWIYSIARNHVISRHRKLSVRPEGHAVEVDDAALTNIISEMDISREVDRDILRQKVSQVLDQMDDKYREVLVLKFLEEKSYQEISDIIMKPVGTVGSMISRAKEDFKKSLMKIGIIL